MAGRRDSRRAAAWEWARSLAASAALVRPRTDFRCLRGELQCQRRLPTAGQHVVPPEVRKSGGGQCIGIALSGLAPLFQITLKCETASIVLAHGQIYGQIVAPCPDECDVRRKFVV